MLIAIKYQEANNYNFYSKAEILEIFLWTNNVGWIEIINEFRVADISMVYR